MDNLKIGDNIFHKSNSSIAWTVEKIENDKVFCSTLIKETLEQKKEIFLMTSIEKCAKPSFISGGKTRSNHY
ncbi:hypothetical protein [uncultured Wocania sp.]|uniref:hypothetical protein n=1 Tax=uncultured Wocania sp. TaxID=2834404 RepID=UPI0030FBDD8C